MIYTTALSVFFGVAVTANHSTDRKQTANQKSEVVLLFVFSLRIDREGSKSQLRHTEPPREENKKNKIQNVRGKKKKVSPEIFVQHLLNVTFQQEQQQSAV